MTRPTGCVHQFLHIDPTLDNDGSVDLSYLCLGNFLYGAEW